MNKITEYIQKVSKLIETVEKTQIEAIERACEAVAECLKNDGMIYTFGTGHSHMLAEEIFYRAGGLIKVYPILDEPLMLHTGASRSSMMERLQGYAELLINNNLGIKKGDIMFVFSNSGRNTVSVEMAIEAKKAGMTVICITNLKHTSCVTSRHPSGMRLFEVCDIVINNCGEIGDSCISIGDVTCGPTSTVIGSMIMQAIICGAVDRLTEQGIRPEVFLSGNIDGSDVINEKYIKKYNNQIKIL